MQRFRRIHQIAAAAVAALASIGSARAGITLAFNIVTLGGTPDANTLNASGWIGVRVSIVADAASVSVAGFDLETNAGGTYGTFHQVTRLTDPAATGVWTTTQMTTQATAPTGTSTTMVDSFFDSYVGKNFGGGVPLQEDNNGFNGSNPPYTRSPLTDTGVLGGPPGDPDTIGAFANDYGVGGRLHGDGVFHTNKTQTQVLAFLIIHPDYATYPGYGFRVVGDFIDGTEGTTVFHVDTAVPEPASLGILTAGALMLITRRRTR